jgi:hypothetical protein
MSDWQKTLLIRNHIYLFSHDASLVIIGRVPMKKPKKANKPQGPNRPLRQEKKGKKLALRALSGGRRLPTTAEGLAWRVGGAVHAASS